MVVYLTFCKIMAKALANKKTIFNATEIFNTAYRGKEKSFTELEHVDARELNGEYTGIKTSASPHCSRVKIATATVIIVVLCLIVCVVVIVTRNNDDENRGKQTNNALKFAKNVD